ncbi:MAG: phosphoglycerate kinase [Thermoplasmata archaeon]|nr:phosphoglycerate kinase [Thermoplasmata archaeon]
MKEFLTLDDFDLTGSNVLVRTDINSPMDPTTGRILNDARIRRHVSTIKDLRDSKVVVLAHQSRPGKADFTTTRPHARRMSYLLRKRVKYVDGLYNTGTIECIKSMKKGDVLILENVRFYAEEIVMKNQPVEKQGNTLLVKTLAPLFDYFVQDAFACAHRSQPSIVGFSRILPTLAGRVMEKEIVMLDRLLQSEQESKIAILGGLKVDDSIEITGHFLSGKIMSEILTTGAVATMFLLAKGIDVGEASTGIVAKEVENLDEEVEKAKGLLKKFGKKILIPTDVVVNDDGKRVGMPVEELPSEYPIYDIGLDTLVNYSSHIKEAGAAALNGPPGVFEINEFSLGTKEIFLALANSEAFTVVGGGHTIAAAEEMGVIDRFDHVSTGGGSLIAYLTGKELPAIQELKESYKRFSRP